MKTRIVAASAVALFLATSVGVGATQTGRQIVAYVWGCSTGSCEEPVAEAETPTSACEPAPYPEPNPNVQPQDEVVENENVGDGSEAERRRAPSGVRTARLLGGSNESGLRSFGALASPQSSLRQAGALQTNSNALSSTSSQGNSARTGTVIDASTVLSGGVSPDGLVSLETGLVPAVVNTVGNTAGLGLRSLSLLEPVSETGGLIVEPLLQNVDCVLDTGVQPALLLSMLTEELCDTLLAADGEPNHGLLQQLRSSAIDLRTSLLHPPDEAPSHEWLVGELTPLLNISRKLEGVYGDGSEVERGLVAKVVRLTGHLLHEKGDITDGLLQPVTQKTRGLLVALAGGIDTLPSRKAWLLERTVGLLELRLHRAAAEVRDKTGSLARHVALLGKQVAHEADGVAWLLHLIATDQRDISVNTVRELSVQVHGLLHSLSLLQPEIGEGQPLLAPLCDFHATLDTVQVKLDRLLDLGQTGSPGSGGQTDLAGKLQGILQPTVARLGDGLLGLEAPGGDSLPLLNGPGGLLSAGRLAEVNIDLARGNPLSSSVRAKLVELLKAEVDLGNPHLLRGPLHEAFGHRILHKLAPGEQAPRQPPAPLTLAPKLLQAIQQDGHVWTPGYWTWSPLENDFQWVAGVLRRPPVDRVWEPGGWVSDGDGYRRLPGAWLPKTVKSLLVRQLPLSLEKGPDGSAPGPDALWTAGVWDVVNNHWQWKPGFWTKATDDRLWVPTHWIKTLGGARQVPGYWDFPLSRRGRLFVPLQLEALTSNPGEYTLAALDTQAVFRHLFVAPNEGGLWFGDLYDAGSHGFLCWNAGDPGTTIDPLFNFYNSQYRLAGIDLGARLQGWQSLLTQNAELRPGRLLHDALDSQLDIGAGLSLLGSNRTGLAATVDLQTLGGSLRQGELVDVDQLLDVRINQGQNLVPGLTHGLSGSLNTVTSSWTGSTGTGGLGGLTGGIGNTLTSVTGGLGGGTTGGLTGTLGGVTGGLTGGSTGGLTGTLGGVAGGLTGGSTGGLTGTLGGVTGGLTGGSTGGLTGALGGVTGGSTGGLGGTLGGVAGGLGGALGGTLGGLGGGLSH
ncbi:YXWGXW repeat-containing protein [Lignipirellula cremea]|uniref:Uncharacterized protein n=1 Tax=Lignipirellula cremea TaxID=2528010 RepID=A0A518DYP2_9BACT|nr:YXWGXW repeat-containing protein [Lignipirellula cremea]QDU96957.1 hypothetical protein Pla8534_47820 [Lignipirellula cremea]